MPDEIQNKPEIQESAESSGPDLRADLMSANFAEVDKSMHQSADVSTKGFSDVASMGDKSTKWANDSTAPEFKKQAEDLASRHSFSNAMGNIKANMSF